MWRKPRRILERTKSLKTERAQRGQSLVIIAGAAIALVAIVGLAIDLGMMYVERIRLGRACDAAALAGAQELPYEEQAARRAMEYLEENNYNLAELGLTVEGPGNLPALGHPAPDGARGDFIIRAHSQDDPSAPEPTALLSVEGTIRVPMSFMVLLGFDHVPVHANAMAENVLQRLDVAIVYDKSGSMNDDTYCFKCYKEEDQGPGAYGRSPPPECHGCYETVVDPDTGVPLDYPEGARMYLPCPDEPSPSGPFGNDYCGASRPVIHGGYEILVAEAEWFSNSTSVEGGPNDYHRSTYEQGVTFWMLQRVRDSQASGHRYEEDDQRGAHLMHMPNLYWMAGHRDTDQAPQLDYDIDLPTPGNWYVWARAQCGPWGGTAERTDGCVLHWGADGEPLGSTSSGDFGTDGNTITDNRLCWPEDCRPPREGGARGNRWIWVRLGAVNTGSNRVQINLWGGGVGLRLDKLLLTRNPEGPSNLDDRAPSFIQDTTPTWNEVRSNPYQSYRANGRYGGPFDTGGRNGMACNPCNPIYGTLCGQTEYDDIFDDAQPVRAAQEAAKGFIQRMRARFDQVAFVKYSSFAEISRELNCVWQRGVLPLEEYGLGVYEPGIGPDPAWTWCFDHRTGTGGYEGPPSDNLADGSVIYAIEGMVPLGSTNISQGLQRGIEVLDPTQGHSRPYATRFIILMTDGAPNRWPNHPNAHECYAGDLWPVSKDDYPDDTLWPEDGEIVDESISEEEARARDCTIFFAEQAKNAGIAVFTIGLGVNVDDNLLIATAVSRGDINHSGEYYAVINEDQLRAAFDDIANHMELRLVE